MSKKIVTGVFETRADAQRAVMELERRGFRADEITMMVADKVGREGWAVDSKSKAPEGAAVGAATGGVIGALIAGLTSVGVVATGGVGILAAGPLVAALAGAGAGGGAGGILGGLIGAGIPEHEAEFIERELEQGHVLVGVHADGDRADMVEDIFESEGAVSVKDQRG
jgi:hypothetical protein